MARAKKSSWNLKVRPLSERGDISAWTDNELVSEARMRNISVNIMDCFSSRDVMVLQRCLEELEHRGYEVRSSREILITKKK